MADQAPNHTPGAPTQTYQGPPNQPIPPQPTSSQLPQMPEPQDTAMTEAPSSAAPIHSTATTTLQPQQPRTATPTRHINGTGPGTTVDAAPPMPSKAAAHGAPVRRYLNEKVTGVLLEGMKKLAAEQPEDPLKVLGEYLLSRSKELEGSQPGL